jgi:hypothetical protein
MASRKAGAVQTRKANVVESQTSRQDRHRPHTVTRGALPLGVAGRAEIACARRARAVLTNKVAVVNHVVVGERALGGEVDVASVAITHRPLVSMLVAAEARGHLRKYGVGARLCDLHMAVNAVALGGEHVLRVRETQLRARERDGLSDVRFAMATFTGSLIVRLLVAAAAGGIRRKVQRSWLAGQVDAHVTFDAVDPLENVRSVLKRPRSGLAANAKQARTRGERDGENHEERQPRPHRTSSARETRSKASAS